MILLLLLRYICATDAFDGGNHLLEVPPILQARKPLFNTSLPSFTFCLHFLGAVAFPQHGFKSGIIVVGAPTFVAVSHDSADVKEKA